MLFWIQKDFKKKGNQSVTNIAKWEIEFRVKIFTKYSNKKVIDLVTSVMVYWYMVYWSFDID